MAVYTPLTQQEIEAFLAQYDVGELASFEGIVEGVSNSNYLVVTTQAKYILTLFENIININELPYFTHLMAWWHARGIHCPQPMAMRDERVLSALKEKPALLVNFLEGSGVTKITLDHMLQLGTLAAQMHLTGMDFPYVRANALSLSGWEALIDAIDGRADDISPGLTRLISEEYNYLEDHWPQDLPAGPIHADLFPDNVFFSSFPSPFGGEGGVKGKASYGALLKHSPLPNPPPQGGRVLKLCGVIDFYFACNDAWAYDLAICANAWCFDDRHRFVPERAQAMVQAYTQIRSLTPEEDAAFPLLLRGAALRFLLTRAHDWLHRDPSAQVTPKDPMEYVAKLRFWQENRL